MKDEKDSQEKADRNSNHKEQGITKPLLLTASGDATCDAKARCDPEHQQHNTDRSLWEKIRSKDAVFWQAVFTGLAFVALVAYTYYTRKQWKTLDENVTEISEFFRIDERAWIEIEPIKPIPFSPRNGKFGAVFKYEIYPKNVGKTAARDIELRSAPGLTTSITAGNNLQWATWQQDRLLLGRVPSASEIPVNNPLPKVLAAHTVSSVPFVISGQEPQIFTKDEWVSYLIGRIDYSDEFQVPHWIKFCFFVADSKGNLRNCKEGNDEDRNPETPPKDRKCTIP
jgi:hypothetical protein